MAAWFSSDCCWETFTLIFGKVREGSCWSTEGAFTKLMPCSNSLTASFMSFSFLPFILFKFLHNMSKRPNKILCKHFQYKQIGIKEHLFLWCLSSLVTLILSIFGIAFRTFSATFLSYLSGLFRFLSNSKVES